MQPLTNDQQQLLTNIYPELVRLAAGDDDILSELHEVAVDVVSDRDLATRELILRRAEIVVENLRRKHRRSRTRRMADEPTTDTPTPVFELLDGLEDREREVVRLKVVGGYTWDEIARRVDLSSRHCRRIYAQTMRRFRRGER